MKEYLADRVRSSPTPVQGRNVTREYLQARILGSFHRAGAMIPLAFHGGTALRWLYGSARYSEDLDFAVEGSGLAYDFRAYLQAIRAELAAEGHAVELKVNDRKAVHSAFVRCPGLLYELGLSPHRNEVLSVKIEVDTKRNWREAVRDRLQTLAWQNVVADVCPFLEPGADPDLLTRETVMRVLGPR